MKLSQKRLFCLLLSPVLIVGIAFAQNKKVIKSVDDIPKFEYSIEGKPSELLISKTNFESLLIKVKKDQESILEEYTIEDKTLLKDIYSTLASIDVFENKLDEALSKFSKIKELQEKPAAKLTSGLVGTTRIEALQKSSSSNPNEVFKNILTEKVSQLPWEVVQDDIERTKGSFEIYSENLIMGIIQEQIDPVVEKTDGKLGSDFAKQLISMKYTIDYVLPLKQEIIEVYTQYIDAHKVQKEDIWKERDIDISTEANLNDVLIAIWDSGVDSAIFKNQMFVNTKEVYDGKDSDGNGYVDDVYGIAYDIDGNKTQGLLYPLDEQQQEKLNSMINLTKGLSDLQSNISSKEASDLKAYMSQIKPEEVKPFIEELGLFGNYSHGTHVSGIAVAGNPNAKILASRITFDYHMIPVCPTIEQAKKDALSVTETIAYFKENSVRAVNMSFGGTVSGVESALEMNGKGDTPEERKKMAREIFDIGKNAFYEAIKSVPEILFVAAAGNSDEDSEFYDAIPSSFNLPNILTVGAVDQAGEETDFSSFGENVDVHANGFEVESYIPGGKKMKYSGTSMASPNVVNLVGKILALDPSLDVSKVIQFIKEGSDVSEDGRIILINPKKSIELVKKEMN